MNLNEMINNVMDKVLIQDMIETAVENDNDKRLIQYSLDEGYKKYFNTQKLLETAAEKGKLKVLSAIIESKGAIECRDENGLQKALSKAAADGQTEAVKIIGSKLKEENFTRSLFYAASEGHTQTAETLIDMGAKLNTVANNPLEIACSSGHSETAFALIKRGADVNFNEDKALKFAVMNGHSNIAKSLVMEHDLKISDTEFFKQWEPRVFDWEKLAELNKKLNQTMTPKAKQVIKGPIMKL